VEDRVMVMVKVMVLVFNFVIKTKVMVFSEKHRTGMIRSEEQEIEWVEQFVYLGCLIAWDDDCLLPATNMWQ
jgi:hypothetical protein